MPETRLSKARVGYENYVYRPPVEIKLSHVETVRECDIHERLRECSAFGEPKPVVTR
jgi:hypothetical protein